MNSQYLLRTELKKILSQKSSKALCLEIGIQPSAFSEFINGKRMVKRRAAIKYFQPIISENIWKKIEWEYEREINRTPQEIPLYLVNSLNQYALNEDHIAVTQDPLHAAVIVAFGLEDYQPSVSWMAAKLEMKEEALIERLERLVRLEIVTKTGSQYQWTGKFYKSTSGIPHPALKTRKKTILKCIENSVEQYPIAEQDFYDLTLCLDPADLPQFKQEVRMAIGRIDRFNAYSKRKRIYSFVMALAPITKN